MNSIRLLTNADTRLPFGSWFNDFEKTFGTLTDSYGSTGKWVPAVDVKENENSYEFEFEVPGFKEDELTVEIKDRKLFVHGQRTKEEKQEKQSYLRIERSYGSFERAFSLPENADQESIDAKLEHGILKVEVKKSALAQPKRVKIAAKS